MKLFEGVIEQRLCSYLEDIDFIDKYQSGFRQNKSTDDHLFRLSQSVMESFNRGEHVVTIFLDIKKALDNVWHNGLRYTIFTFDLPTKMTCWLSDFLVGRVIQVNVNGFLSDKISPRGTTGFCPESITFPDILYFNDFNTDKTQNLSLLMTLLYGLLVKTYNLQQNFCVRTYENWQSGVANGE